MKRLAFWHLFLIFLTSCFLSHLYGGHLPGTLVKTTKGTVSIEKIECGNYVVGFNDHAQSAAESLIELEVHEFPYSLQHQCYIISLKEEELYVSHDQKFFDGAAQKWVKARNLNVNSVLIDIHGCLHQVLEITIHHKPCEMYDISIDAPHLYFTGKTQILTHNIPPVLVYPVAAATVKKVVVTSVICTVALWDFFKYMKHEKRERHAAQQAQQQQLQLWEQQLQQELLRQQQSPQQQQLQPTPDSPAPNQNPEPDKDPERKECEYKDITRGSSISNVQTDVTKEEFESILREDGWNHSKSKDGLIDNYQKNNSRYAVRGFSKSTNSPTAEYYINGKKTPDSKIRLK